jgi:chromosomal replication initiator protein
MATTPANVSPRTWSDILVALRRRHPELTRPWFNDIEPLDMQHGVIRARAATMEQHRYLNEECRAALAAAAQSVTGRLVTVQLLPPEQATPSPTPPLSFEAETESIRLDSDYTFEQFVCGPSNRLAHAACLAAAENPGRIYNPLYIHGDVGLGKTHLLQAVCHRIRELNPEAFVLYISCETFMNHFVEAIERGAIHQFRYRYRHVDVLAIDDIHFLAARERSREEFFHTFNTLYHTQKQIVLSADESPRDIPSLEDRLVSRFNWGLVTRIDAPDLETRMAIIRKKAKRRCIELPEDVVNQIAVSVDSNARELEGALTRVLALAQQYGGQVTASIAREALGDERPGPVREITVSDIFNAVTARYNVRLADLQGKRRNRSVAFPRQICMYLARELTSLSLEEIGGYFGGRDHTTVLHGVRTIAGLRDSDPELSASLQDMVAQMRK